MSDQLNRIKATIQEDFRKKYERLTRDQNDLAHLELPLFPLDPEVRVSIGNSLQLVFPYDPKIIRAIRQLMEESGWGESSYLEEWNGCFYFHSEYPTVEILFKLDHPDATCVRTKIGEDIRTVDIYEVTCVEGAEEKTFIHEEERKDEDSV